VNIGDHDGRTRTKRKEHLLAAVLIIAALFAPIRGIVQ
jgi:hypothetical protein